MPCHKIKESCHGYRNNINVWEKLGGQIAILQTFNAKTGAGFANLQILRPNEMQVMYLLNFHK